MLARAYLPRNTSNINVVYTGKCGQSITCLSLPTFLSFCERTLLCYRADEEDNGQGWQCQRQGIGSAMVWPGRCLNASEVAIAVPVVVPGIAVEHLKPHTSTWHSYPIVEAWHRREIADDKNTLLGREPLAQEAHYTALGVVTVDPGKTRRVTVAFVEGWGMTVEVVQGRDPSLQASMWGRGEQMPVQTRVVIPLPPLTKLSAHEEQFFAGLSIHVSQQQSHIRILLRVVPRHFAQQRAFAVDDLVVRQGQHKVFAEGVQEAEGRRIMMELAIDRIRGHVPQAIMHPAHIPLEPETQATHIRRP